MENQKNIIDIANEAIEQKENVSDSNLNNINLNNNILIDFNIKLSKCLQYNTMLMDFNNTSNIDIKITPDEYKQIDGFILNSLKSLSLVLDKFNKKFKESINVESKQQGEHADVQKPENN